MHPGAHAPTLEFSETASLTPQSLDALYGVFLERGLSYFLPNIQMERLGPAETYSRQIEYQKSENCLQLHWLGLRYRLTNSGRALTVNERGLLKSVGRVLSARYQFFYNAEHASRSFEIFRGTPEDRFVSAFLDPAPYTSVEARLSTPDRIAEATKTWFRYLGKQSA